MSFIRVISNLSIGAATVILVTFGLVPHAIGLIAGSSAGMVAYGLMVFGGLFGMPVSAVLMCAGLIGRRLSRQAAP